jgi:Protein of unknown function (DUF3574)
LREPSLRRRRRAGSVLVLLLLAPILTSSQTAASTAPPGQNPCPGRSDLWTRTELFFGSAKPDGSTVTDEEFRRFLDEEVTPRFPDGLTLLVGLGQYRGASGGLVQEKSMLLVLLHPSNEPDGPGHIEAIRRAYKSRFRQESVLRLDACAVVSF